MCCGVRLAAVFWVAAGVGGGLLPPPPPLPGCGLPPLCGSASVCRVSAVGRFEKRFFLLLRTHRQDDGGCKEVPALCNNSSALRKQLSVFQGESPDHVVMLLHRHFAAGL